MNILHNDAAIAILSSAAQQLQALGIECLLSPMALPQGMTISLHLGDTTVAALAAEVATSRGGEMAHRADSADEFSREVAHKLSEATILKAAYVPPSP